MVFLTVELHEFGLEVLTDIRKDVAHVLQCFFAKHALAVFSHKDQMDVHVKDTMSAVSDIA